MKSLIFALGVVFELAALSAQQTAWQPSPGHTQVPIWPGTPPDAQFGPPANTETMPEPGEVVFCTPQTTLEDLELLFNRFIFAKKAGRQNLGRNIE